MAGGKDVETCAMPLSRKLEAGDDETDSVAYNAVKPIPPEDFSQFEEQRPFFTWFVISAHVIILLISILAYGFGPWGFTRSVSSKKVLVSSLSLQEVDHSEPSNIWFGPPAAALVKLGAKFTPCMRRDRLVYKNIDRSRREERDTGCCVRNDESGCVQTTAERCSSLLSTFHKWNNSTNPGPEMRVPNEFGAVTYTRRTSGTVCSQDPRLCDVPASTHPNEWPDDVSQWPICTKPIRKHLSYPHMSCETIARPCCIGLYGQCHITTQEFCDHVKGQFHEEATLCSQVTCMRDVCRLLPFLDDEHPDQFYRSFLAIFLHAGIFHLVCTVTFHYIVMRDVERMIGSFRLAVIYIVSGIAGNLASAALVPYRAEVGPAGSILGVMASCCVVIIYNWDVLTEPYKNLMSKIVVIALFFLLGLLFPFIDNYAHLAGFLVGAGLSIILIPYNGVGEFAPDTKKILVACGSICLLLILVALILLVWVFPIYDCSFCKYFNCLVSLISDDICPDQDIEVRMIDIL